MTKKIDDVFSHFDNTSVWRTDRQTSCDGIVRVMHTHCAVIINISNASVLDTYRRNDMKYYKQHIIIMINVLLNM